MATTAVEFRTATRAHCEELAPRMRPEDVAEVLASGGKEPLQTLLDACLRSDLAWTVLFNGEVACIWGVAPTKDAKDTGSIWLLTSDLVSKHPVTFTRWVKPCLSVALELFPTLFNLVDARYEKAIHFAERMGFELFSAQPFGVENLPFVPIVIRRPPDV